MEIYIYNPSIELIGVIDLYSSLRWRRRFYEPGEFELHVPATDETLSMLADGNYIHRIDRDEFGVIEGVAVNETEDGDELVITGRMGSSLLEQRIITPTINFSGTAEAAMRKIISDNAITARPISFLTLGTSNGFVPAVSFQATYKAITTALTALAQSSNIGYKLGLNVQSKALIFNTYMGTDRTVTQSSVPYVVFSDEYSNIFNPAYTLNSQGYKNYAYVGGEGVGSARTVVEVDKTGGALRRELWVDAKDLQKGTLSDADYRAQLTQRGIEKLAESAKAESFSADAVNSENFVYLTDWNLGDIVSFEKWGLLLNQRITEAEEIYENGTFTVTPVCGNPLPEVLNLGDDN